MKKNLETIAFVAILNALAYNFVNSYVFMAIAAISAVTLVRQLSFSFSLSIEKNYATIKMEAYKAYIQRYKPLENTY